MGEGRRGWRRRAAPSVSRVRRRRVGPGGGVGGAGLGAPLAAAAAASSLCVLATRATFPGEVGKLGLGTSRQLAVKVLLGGKLAFKAVALSVDIRSRGFGVKIVLCHPK